MDSVELLTEVTQAWMDVPSIQVGRILTHQPTPDLYATISVDGQPSFRVDLSTSSDECNAFQAAVIWEGFVAIGFGEHLYFVDLDSHHVQKFNLKSYFGYLQVNGCTLLAASAERIFCFAPSGELLWRSTQLGIDGVVFGEVNDEYIFGHGEYDPPGGWRAFCISAANGDLIKQA